MGHLCVLDYHTPTTPNDQKQLLSGSFIYLSNRNCVSTIICIWFHGGYTLHQRTICLKFECGRLGLTIAFTTLCHTFRILMYAYTLAFFVAQTLFFKLPYDSSHQSKNLTRTSKLYLSWLGKAFKAVNHDLCWYVNRNPKISLVCQELCFDIHLGNVSLCVLFIYHYSELDFWCVPLFI